MNTNIHIETNSRTFTMIHGLRQFVLFNTFKESLTVYPGTKLNIIFTPLLLASSVSAIRDLDITQRNCKFQTEIDTPSVFKVYSKETCLLECHIKQTYNEIGYMV